MDRAIHGVRDASLKETKALPAAAGTVNSDGIDLGALSDRGGRFLDCEVLLSAPALGATALPDTTTMTYSIQSSATSNFAATTTLAGSCIVQTGSTGAAASTFRMKIPSNCQRYIRASAVGADVGNVSLGNCAGSELTLELLF